MKEDKEARPDSTSPSAKVQSSSSNPPPPPRKRKEVLKRKRDQPHTFPFSLEREEEDSKREEGATFLRQAGNWELWKKVKEGLERSRVHVIHGPCGCGKSRGASSLFSLLGLSTYEMNSFSCSSSQDLTKKLNNVCYGKSLISRKGVIVDDLEGFDSNLLSTLHSFCKSYDEEASSSSSSPLPPILLLTTDYYSLPLRLFRQFRNTLLQRADPRSLFLLFPKEDPLILSYRQKKASSPSFRLSSNLHQAMVQIKNPLLSSSPDEKDNFFDCTRKLIQGRTHLSAWETCEEESTLLNLCHSSYPSFMTLSECSSFSDLLSLFDTTRDISLLGSGLCLSRKKEVQLSLSKQLPSLRRYPTSLPRVEFFVLSRKEEEEEKRKERRRVSATGRKARTTRKS